MLPLPSSESPRLRVERVDYRRGADGSGSVDVGLAHGDRTFAGKGHGLMTREGNLRMGADATLQAITAATGGRLSPVLGGVKALRAFDSWLVIVSIEADVDDTRLRLLGAEAADDGDLVRGSVLAVLDALNRVLERYLGS